MLIKYFPPVLSDFYEKSMKFFYDFNSVDLKIILTQFFSQIDNNNTQTT